MNCGYLSYSLFLMGKPTQIENINTLQQQVCCVWTWLKLEAMSELGLQLFHSEDKSMLFKIPFLGFDFNGYSNITVKKKALADTSYPNLAIPWIFLQNLLCPSCLWAQRDTPTSFTFQLGLIEFTCQHESAVITRNIKEGFGTGVW